MSMTRRDVAGAVGAAVATALVFRSGEAKASKCGNIDSAVAAVQQALNACKNAADDYGGMKASAMGNLNTALGLLQKCQATPQCK